MGCRRMGGHLPGRSGARPAPGGAEHAAAPPMPPPLKPPPSRRLTARAARPASTWARTSTYSGTAVHQLRVGSVGDDLPAVKQHDPVGEADRRQTMGDDQRCAALHQHPQPLVDRLLDLDVDSARGVVENQDRRVDEQRARDRNSLALPA